jgi:iron(III) transport system permease protein
MKKAPLYFLLLILFAVCVYPFLFLGESFSFENGHFDWAIYKKAFSSSMTARSFRNTLLVCGSCVIFSTFISLPLAWLFTRTDVPFRGFWRTTFCLPYAIPPFLGAIAWIYLANPSTGLLLGIFPWVNIYSMTGLIFVMTAFFYTFILINVMTAMEKIDPSLEEAARISGASSLQIFFRVTLPLVTPSLISGMLLAFLSSIASFGIAALIGNPAGITLMTTQIVLFQKMASYTGLKLSGILSLSLLILALGVFILDYYIGKRFRFSLVTGKASRASLIELGKSKVPALIFPVIEIKCETSFNISAPDSFFGNNFICILLVIYVDIVAQKKKKIRFRIFHCLPHGTLLFCLGITHTRCESYFDLSLIRSKCGKFSGIKNITITGCDL